MTIGGQKLANSTALVATAKARGLRVTPQKARRVVNMIRGQRLDQALNIVKFSPQIAVSEDVYVLLNSALANAKQKNPNIRDAKELWVTEAVVNEGMTMKRFRPRAQGRGYQILKRSSQISVVISDDKNYRPDLKIDKKIEKEPTPVVEAKVNTEATSTAEVSAATGEEVSK